MTNANRFFRFHSAGSRIRSLPPQIVTIALVSSRKEPSDYGKVQGGKVNDIGSSRRSRPFSWRMGLECFLGFRFNHRCK